jgi:hypothetical protein
MLGDSKMTKTVGRFFYVPKAIATTPANGDCRVNYWWVVHPEKGLLYYYTPFAIDLNCRPAEQANKSRDIVEHIMATAFGRSCYAGHVIEQIPQVFQYHAFKEMKKDKTEYDRMKAMEQATKIRARLRTQRTSRK